MATVVAVANLKGGTGKSTISLALATTLHDAGTRVLLVDADSQATCRQWAVRASESGQDGPPVVSIDARALARDLEKIAEPYEVVVIDTPGRLGAEARSAMLRAHMVVLPVAPRPADIWALQETLLVVEEAQALRPDLKKIVVLNRVNRTVLTRVGIQALSSLGVEVADAQLTDRVAHGEAMLNGIGVNTLDPAAPAAAEARALTQAVLEAI